MSKVLPTAQVPGIYRRRVGQAIVTAVSDGTLHGNTAILQNIGQAEIDAILGGSKPDGSMMITVNAFLVETPEQTVLIDTGAGTLMGPTLGMLIPNLAAAGVVPSDIDAVLVTHLHTDHIGGLINADGQPVFPNAQVFIAKAEADYWFDDARLAAGEDMQARVERSRRVTQPYRDRIVIFDGTTPLPGIEAVPLPGHTPGHTGYMVGTDADRVLVWGDIMHAPPVQSAKPGATVVYDSNPAMAVATRRSILAHAANEHLLVAGMHLNFPAFAYVVRDGDGFALGPVMWSSTL